MNTHRRDFSPTSNGQLVLLSVLVLLVCLFYTCAAVYLAPYPGLELGTGLVVERLEPCAAQPAWCAANQNILQPGDRLLAIGDLTYAEAVRDRRRIPFASYKPGDLVSITFRRAGEERTVDWRVLGPTIASRTRRLTQSLLLYVPFWLAGTLVLLFLQPRDRRWRLLIVFNYATAIWLAAGVYSNLRVAYTSLAQHALAWLLAPVYLHLHLIVPGPLLRRHRRRFLLPLYATAVVLALLELFQTLPGAAFNLGLLLAFLGSLGLLAFRLLASPSAADELATRLMLAGIGLAFGPAIVLGVVPALLGAPPPTGLALNVATLAIPLLPFFYVYALYKRRLGPLEFRANRLLSLYSFILLYATTFVLAFFVGSQWLSIPDDSVVFSLVVSTLFVVAALPLRARFQRLVDRLAYGTEHDPDDVLRVFANRIPAALDRQALVRLLADEVVPSLLIRQSALLLLADGEADLVYARGVSVSEAPQQIERLLAGAGRYRPPPAEGQDEYPGGHGFDWVRLAVPVEVQEKTVGLWLFGRRAPDDYYPQHDVALLTTLAGQVAVALENARLHRESRQHLAKVTALQEAERRYLEMRALHDVALDITAQMEMPELLSAILERACSLLRVTEGAIVEYQPDREQFKVLAGHGPAANYTGVTFGKDVGIAGQVLQTGQPQIVGDVLAERGLLFDADVKTAIAVPLRWRERIIGVLDVVSRDERRALDQRDQHLLTLFADQAAIAMKNARLYAQVVAAEERQRAILASSSDAIVTMDLDGNLTSVSPAVEEITGYSVDEWLADISWPSTVHPDDLPALQAGFQRVVAEQTGGEALSARLRRKDGCYIWVQVKGNILRDATGRPTGVVAVVRDVTADKRAQEEIARRNRELATLNEISSIVSRSLELDTILNDALRKVWEVATPEDAAGCVLLATGDYLTIGAQRQLPAGLVQKLTNIESDRAALRSPGAEDVEILAALSKTGEAVRTMFSDEGFRSFVVAPLLSRRQGMGLLVIASRREQSFSPQSVDLITAAGYQIGMAVANAHLFGEVAREKSKLEYVLQSVADGVYTTDRHLRITSFNRAAGRLTGIESSEAVGRLCSEVLHTVSTTGKPLCDEQSCIVRQAMRDRRPTLSSLHERVLVSRDGRTIPIISVAAPLFDEAGNVIGCVVAFWDVSREAEVERMKREFVSLVSHELRTPLTTIGVAAEWSLQRDGAVSDDERREMWTIVREQSARLRGFVEQILDVTRLDAGQIPVNLAPVAVDSVVEQVVLDHRRKYPTRSFEVHVADHARCVLADETHLEVILDNFVDNALKYSPDEKGIRIETDRRDDGMVVISVVDQGMGIPSRDLSRVFEKFYRCDGSDAQTVYGYGLGLYIVKVLAELQGGQVWAESEPGVGSRFNLALPVAEHIHPPAGAGDVLAQKRAPVRL